MHTGFTLGAVAALQQSAFEVGDRDAVVVLAHPSVTKLLSGRADAGHLYWVEIKITGRDNRLAVLTCRLLVTLAVLVFLLSKARVATAEAIIRDVAVDLPVVQVLHIRFVGEARVSRDDGALLVDAFGDAQFLIAGFDRFQHRF